MPSETITRLLDPTVGVGVLIALLVWVARGRAIASARWHAQRLGDAALDPGQRFDVEEQRSRAASTANLLGFLAPAILIGVVVHAALASGPWHGHLGEWLNLLVRWTHVIAGIMWIGASFYFIFLENHLNRVRVREELAGDLWAVHGGGFYHVEKYRVAPAVIPADLHWFKYEAYFTWLTGVAMLVLVYWLDPRTMMVGGDPALLTPMAAVAVGASSVVIAWFGYDALCRSPLGQRPAAFAVVGVGLMGAATWLLCELLPGRAAYLHVGAMLGTMMAGNVFFVIIPSQKALVRSALAGETLDASLGARAGQRSLHNNYFTLPVVFTMVSHHFPSTFGHVHNGLVLMVVGLAGAGVRHYWNLRDRGRHRPALLAASLALLVAVAVFVAPRPRAASGGGTVAFTEVRAVMDRRCRTCHSARPVDETWTSAPSGVVYDTPEQIVAMAARIQARAVDTESMPLGNKTGMTPEERELLGRWIAQGARADR